MKSEIIPENKEKEPCFPALYREKGRNIILLFFSRKVSTIVHLGEDASFQIGYQSKTWDCFDSNVWEPYYGKVVLTS